MRYSVSPEILLAVLRLGLFLIPDLRISTGNSQAFFKNSSRSSQKVRLIEV